GTTYPPLGDGACSNLGAGCVTPDRAALNIGTSGALRAVREGEPDPRDGLFSYFLDERRVVEGGAVSDGGNVYAWAQRTLKLGEVEPREPGGHGLTFLPLLGGERSLGWDPRAAGPVAGRTLDTHPLDRLQAGLEGIAYRIAEIADRMPEVREIVATGHALLESTWWMQVFADALGKPLVASGVAEGSARGAAVYVLERLGCEPGPAPLGRTFDPDPRRGEIYAAARERQDPLYHRLPCAGARPIARPTGLGKVAVAAVALACASVPSAEARPNGTLQLSARLVGTYRQTQCPPGVPSTVDCFHGDAGGVVSGLGDVTEAFTLLEDAPSET